MGSLILQTRYCRTSRGVDPTSPPSAALRSTSLSAGLFFSSFTKLFLSGSRLHSLFYPITFKARRSQRNPVSGLTEAQKSSPSDPAIILPAGSSRRDNLVANFEGGRILVPVGCVESRKLIELSRSIPAKESEKRRTKRKDRNGTWFTPRTANARSLERVGRVLMGGVRSCAFRTVPPATLNVRRMTSVPQVAAVGIGTARANGELVPARGGSHWPRTWTHGSPGQVGGAFAGGDPNSRVGHGSPYPYPKNRVRVRVAPRRVPKTLHLSPAVNAARNTAAATDFALPVVPFTQ